MRPATPGAVSDRLDGLNRAILLLARRLERIEVLRVVARLDRREVVRQQDRVEVESLQAAAMGGRDLRAVARDADEPHETFLARLDGRVDSPAGAERVIPLDRIGQIVQLPQVNMVDLHTLERALQVLARLISATLAGLGGEEKLVRVALQPGRNTELRVAVTRGHV